MYSYERALGLSRSIGSQWEEVDLEDKIVFDIFQNYSKVYLVLNNSALVNEVFVDFDVLKPLYSSFNDTLAQLLVTIGNTTLPTVDGLPDTIVKFARYSDAVRVGYKIKPCVAGTALPDNYPAEALIDLKVTRDQYKTDMQLVEDYCLLSVNGYIHSTDANGDAAYVYDGGKTMRKSKLNHLGILSFLDIGKLTKIKIKAADIKPVTVGTALRDKINFTVEENLENKSYILVIGGYMVFPGHDVFWRSGQNGFTLDINRISYKERVFESTKYIDLEPLGLTKSTSGDNVYDVDELFSDEVIRKYMTLSQSFLVLVDVPNLVANKIFVRHSALPGMFTTYQDPTYPLIVNYGKVAEYWKTHEDGHWAVNVQDSYLRNYVASSQRPKEGQVITDNVLASKPFYHSRGYFLELAGYKT